MGTSRSVKRRAFVVVVIAALVVGGPGVAGAQNDRSAVGPRRLDGMHAGSARGGRRLLPDLRQRRL